MSTISQHYSCNVTGAIDDCIQKYSNFNRLFREFEQVTIERFTQKEINDICLEMIKENEGLTEDAMFSDQYSECVLPIFIKLMQAPDDADLPTMYLDESKACVMEWTKSELRCLIDERMKFYVDTFGEAA